MYLTQHLRRTIQQNPGGIASVFQGRRRTFSELGERVARLGGMLRQLGVKPGDRVGMLALNSDWYLEYYPGVYWSGGAVNPINTRWSVAEIAYSLQDCQTGILLVDDHFTEIVAELRSRCTALHTVIHVGDGAPPEGMYGYETLLTQTDPVDDAMRGGEDLAGVFYTGGTTGLPKGVMLPHRGLYTNSLSFLAEGTLRPGCIGLHAAPLFHLATGGFMNSLFTCGSTHVMIPRFDPLAMLEAIQNEGVTDTMLVPTMLQILVDYPEVGRYRLGRLRGVIYGASPISEDLLDRAMKVLPSAEFTQGYGMTELSPIATILPPEMHLQAGRAKGRHRSNGRAAIGCEVCIMNENGQEVPRGTIGEIAVRGPGVMLGYWNKPVETAAAVRDGWMHTGDGGYMDEDGYIYLLDRLKDMIITGGENVYSLEVENAITSHPAVATCAVIGIPDSQWGEAVYAFVVTKDGASVSEQEIITYCKQHIAGYKCPQRVSFMGTLPLSGAGKVLKTQLRAPFWQGQDKSIA